jgi:hypothetical protein
MRSLLCAFVFANAGFAAALGPATAATPPWQQLRVGQTVSLDGDGGGVTYASVCSSEAAQSKAYEGDQSGCRQVPIGSRARITLISNRTEPGGAREFFRYVRVQGGHFSGWTTVGSLRAVIPPGTRIRDSALQVYIKGQRGIDPVYDSRKEAVTFEILGMDTVDDGVIYRVRVVDGPRRGLTGYTAFLDAATLR